MKTTRRIHDRHGTVPAPRGTDHLELAPAERVEWVAESVTLDPLEMLARLCQHIPPPGLHPTRM